VSFNVAMLKQMKAEGLDFDASIRVLEAGEKKADATNAARQARHRAKKASNTVTVTGVTPPNDKELLSPKEKVLPQEANASLPQGAKTKRDAVPWPCPTGVDPSHWRDFLAGRRRKRCVWTQTALDAVLSDLDTISDDEWPPGRLVQHAAAKGWASINDPRKPMNGQGNGQSGTAQRPIPRARPNLTDIIRATSGPSDFEGGNGTRSALSASSYG
jgi:hypothetical protein